MLFIIVFSPFIVYLLICFSVRLSPDEPQKSKSFNELSSVRRFSQHHKHVYPEDSIHKLLACLFVSLIWQMKAVWGPNKWTHRDSRCIVNYLIKSCHLPELNVAVNVGVEAKLRRGVSSHEGCCSEENIANNRRIIKVKRQCHLMAIIKSAYTIQLAKGRAKCRIGSHTRKQLFFSFWFRSQIKDGFRFSNKPIKTQNFKKLSILKCN